MPRLLVQVRAFLPPLADRLLVGGVVVQHGGEFHARVGGGDLLQEAQELLTAMARVAGVGADPPRGQFKGGEQGGGSVALVVVGLAGGQARPQREHRGSPVQGLDLRLLVHADHHGVFGRVQVQAHDVADLGLKLGVRGELERLDPVRGDAPLAPDPGHRRNEIRTSAARNRADQCVIPSRSGGLPPSARVASTRSASPTFTGRSDRLVLQRPDPAGLVAVTPADHRRPRHPHSLRDWRVRHPIGGQQRSRPASPGPTAHSATSPDSQLVPVTLTKHQRRS